jgi:hypothetical protein
MCVARRSKVRKREHDEANMIESGELNWRKGAHGFTLHLRQAKSPLLHVVPDNTYSGMWRIRLSDSRLTAMVNLPRAKDAGLSVALASLNAKKDYRESAPETPPIAPNDCAATPYAEAAE